MDVARLLSPFLPDPLAAEQVAALSRYLELLLRWNARINLTAVREPEQIVTRHFGESLFAASRLLEPDSRVHAVDVGSGAGFPGLPLKIYAPQLRLTLIEAHNKKATFLKEAVRTLALDRVEVFAGRAEKYSQGAELVTLRAVERFESVLPVAAALLRRAGGEAGSGSREGSAGSAAARLALLIGAAQSAAARSLLPGFAWDSPIPIPQSAARVLLVGHLSS